MTNEPNAFAEAYVLHHIISDGAVCNVHHTEMHGVVPGVEEYVPQVATC